MSIWTHCSGVIRLDAVRYDKKDSLTKKDFNKIFIQSTWHKYNENCNMPQGDEGSIEYSLNISDDLDCVANAYVLTFTGDLRSYNNIDEIIEWWKSIPQLIENLQAETNKSCYIRDGSMVVYTEFSSEATLLGFVDDCMISQKISIPESQ